RLQRFRQGRLALADCARTARVRLPHGWKKRTSFVDRFTRRLRTHQGGSEDMGDRIDLTGKNILITGGSMGLGFASAQACLEAGGNVVICARHEIAVAEAVEQLSAIAGPQRIRGIAADVTNQESIDSALDLLEASFGTVTSLIHAAAVPGPIGNITTVDPA